MLNLPQMNRFRPIEIPAGQELGDLGPPVADGLVEVVDEPVLLGAPRTLADLRVEVVVPSVTDRENLGCVVCIT